MNIEHISVSRSQCYNTCAAQYKFKYHDKITPDSPEAVHFVLGKVAHKMIEEHTKLKGERDIYDIMHDILVGKIEVDTKGPLSLDSVCLNRLKKHAANYLKLAAKIGYEGEVEWKFRIDLDPPNKREIIGFIDRIIFTPGGATIIDYKTTKVSPWRKDSTNITTDIQLACYCWVISREFNLSPDKIQASLYYLEDGKIVAVKFSEKTLSSFPEKMLMLYKEIERVDPDKAPGKVGSHCKWCDAKNICPFYRQFAA